MYAIACMLIGYLLGSILTADLVCFLKTGKRMTTAGLGNPGMANTWATFGWRWGAAVLVGDLGKTALACLACRWGFFPELGAQAALFAGLGAVLGHDFPLYSRFQGGKGVAVTFVMTLCFAPWVALWAYGLGALAVLLSRYLAVGSAVIAVLLPVLTAALGGGFLATLVMAVTGGLMILRHLPNFRRMRMGQESPFELHLQR